MNCSLSTLQGMKVLYGGSMTLDGEAIGCHGRYAIAVMTTSALRVQ
jgi:hypothetical protein